MTLKLSALALCASLILSACVQISSMPFSSEPFRQEAESGDPMAQTQLGQSYLLGLNGVQDMEMAVYWLERAAAKTEPQALFFLGAMREKGQGFPKDIKGAYDFYLRAAKLNNGPAQEALARIYAFGLLGKVDNVESHKWYILSARHGFGIHATDFMAARHLTADEMKQAEAEADALIKTF